MDGGTKGETGEHQLFAFPATESNDVVRPIHAKAVPVLLTSPCSRLDKEGLCSKSESRQLRSSRTLSRTSAKGHNEKNSQRAYVFRNASDS